MLFPPILYIIIVFLIFPSVLFYSLAKVKATSVRIWLHKTVPLLLVALFFFFVVNWSWVSHYLRYPFWGVVLIMVFSSYQKIRPSQVIVEPSTPSRTKIWMQGLNEALSYILPLIFLLYVAKGYFYTGEAVDLSFPLQGGVYYVGHGGDSRAINYHNGVESQQYAVDILAVNQFGARAQWIYPTVLERYEIYGAPVTSPCAGTVLTAVDQLADLTPPMKDVQYVAGNHLIIECKDVQVVLAHLKQGTVVVQPGDTVADGQLLAQVGNSGNTTEPHLHVHAVRGDAESILFGGKGVPILFDDRFLTRNSIVNK